MKILDFATAIQKAERATTGQPYSINDNQGELIGFYNHLVRYRVLNRPNYVVAREWSKEDGTYYQVTIK